MVNDAVDQVQRPTEKDQPRFSRQEYASFIGQIQLRTVWLEHAKISNYHGPHAPRQATFPFDSHATWTTIDGGFRVLHVYEARVQSRDDVLAEIEVVFGLDFESEQLMSAEIFSVFEDVNLPVNTWPFLREFVSTTTGRMGWVPFTIPALKRGVKRRAPSTNTRAQRPPQPRAKPPVGGTEQG